MATRKTSTPSSKTPASAGTKRRAAASTPSKRKPAAKPRASAAKAAAAQPAKGRKLPFGIFALGTLAAAGAAAFAFFRRTPSEGTNPTDLKGNAHPDGSTRAIDDFRPDPTAPIPASEREQFRPALVGATTILAGNGRDRPDGLPN